MQKYKVIFNKTTKKLNDSKVRLTEKHNMSKKSPLISPTKVVINP